MIPGNAVRSKQEREAEEMSMLMSYAEVNGVILWRLSEGLHRDDLTFVTLKSKGSGTLSTNLHPHWGRTAWGHSTGRSRLFCVSPSCWPENKLRQVMPGARELSGTVCKPIKEGSG